MPCALIAVLLMAVLGSGAFRHQRDARYRLLLAQFLGYAMWFGVLYFILKVRYGRAVLVVAGVGFCRSAVSRCA